MKFGLRRPSLRKRIAARTSLRRYVPHSLKVKAPRGYGWVTNPRRAAYNRIYNRTTFGVGDLVKVGVRRKSGSGSPIATLAIILALFVLILVLR